MTRPRFGLSLVIGAAAPTRLLAGGGSEATRAAPLCEMLSDPRAVVALIVTGLVALLVIALALVRRIRPPSPV